MAYLSIWTKQDKELMDGKAEFISVNRFAEIFDVKPARVREYVAEGSLKGIRLRGTIRIPLEEVNRVKRFGLEAKSEPQLATAV